MTNARCGAAVVPIRNKNENTKNSPALKCWAIFGSSLTGRVRDTALKRFCVCSEYAAIAGCLRKQNEMMLLGRLIRSWKLKLQRLLARDLHFAYTGNGSRDGDVRQCATGVFAA